MGKTEKTVIRRFFAIDAASDADCGARGHCILDPGWDGGYCTYYDCPTTPCPGTGTCAVDSTGDTLCLASCSLSSDCRTGYVCQTDVYGDGWLGIIHSMEEIEGLVAELNDLRREFGLTVKVLEEDLRHIERSVRSAGKRLQVSAPRCDACDFEFRSTALHPPGRCPSCRNRRISGPWLRI